MGTCRSIKVHGRAEKSRSHTGRLLEECVRVVGSSSCWRVRFGGFDHTNNNQTTHIHQASQPAQLVYYLNTPIIIIRGVYILCVQRRDQLNQQTLAASCFPVAGD